MDGVTVPPPLDRQACRDDVEAIATWRAELDRTYQQLLAAAKTTRPQDAERIRDFEQRCRDDQEWASGYVAGRADALRAREGKNRSGPGISWFGDGYSAGVTRQSAYELGLADART
jgi:hypothetical protein